MLSWRGPTATAGMGDDGETEVNGMVGFFMGSHKLSLGHTPGSSPRLSWPHHASQWSLE